MTDTATVTEAPHQNSVTESFTGDDLLNFDGVDLTDTAVKIQEWINTYILSAHMAIQIAVILAAFILGSLLARGLKPTLTRAVESLRLSVSLRGVLHNIRRLSGPILTLGLLFLYQTAITALGLEWQSGLIGAAQNLVAAWVIVSIVVQLVSNPYARKITAAIIWGIAALSILGVLDDTARTLDGIGMDFGDFRLSGLTVVKAMLAILVLVYLATSVSRLVDQQVQQNSHLTVAARILISKVTRMVLVILAILVGISMAGVDLSNLAIFTGAIGLGIGFGLQRGISNVFTGMMLLLDRSVQPGDVIELPNGTFGVVEQMGTRCTEVISRDNKSYLIPNEDLVTHQVINWSRGDTSVRMDISFGVDYAHNPHDIIAMASEAAKLPDRVLQDPAPLCHFKGFGDSSLDFSLRFWIKDAENGITNIKSAVLLALWDVFEKNNIKIPYPHREIITK